MKNELEKYIKQLKKEIADEEQLKRVTQICTHIVSESKQQNAIYKSRKQKHTVEDTNSKKWYVLAIITLSVVIIGLLTILFLALKKPTNTITNNYNITAATESNVIVHINPQPEPEPIIVQVPTYVEEETPKMKSDGFVYNDTVIDGWVLKREYQELIYNALEKYGNVVPFDIALAIAYKEQSFNNPKAINNKNYNGTCDIGIMQVNTVHADMVRRVTKCEDVEAVLQKPWPNIRCAVVYMKWIMENYNIQSPEEFLIAYNGGTGTLEKFRNGELTTKCAAYQYAKAVINIYERLQG